MELLYHVSEFVNVIGGGLLMHVIFGGLYKYLYLSEQFSNYPG